ncbi:MAG: C4-dicarboxylate ABC transporter permease [Rhodobacterales bacterium]|nr:MAG: C4-dicarboxylate ABC transporter permease [Rhodobacterales bacterium]
MAEEAATGLWPNYDGWLIQQIEALQGTGWLGWLIGQILEAPYNIVFALTHPGMWLDWSNKEAVMRFVYFGGSKELLFAVLFLFLVVTGIGLASRRFMWGCVRTFEGITNTIGRIAAWAGLLMVLQQILIIFMQRIFAVSQISLGVGASVSKDVSWWAEMLKFENALIVTLCVGYTFVQGGHVRVDLIYAAVSHRVKRIIDMVGSMIFMVPAACLIWMYGWFFLWRHLIVPKPSASDTLDKLLMKSRALRWNVETIGFSPNGFNGYFLFKILLVAFTALVLLQAVTFFYRSYLELLEGEDAVDKYLDHDAQEPIEDEMHASEHLA